jgi:uncharacterized protein YjiS (DUF1127 family)
LLRKWPFPLKVSYLSYAFSALLRRNIIAFRRGKYPYVPGSRFTGQCTDGGRTSERKRKAMFATIVRFVREWKKYNRSLTELSRLGDRELADIGISRSEIHRVAWNAAQRR